ncbi:MAG: hypothetical protein ABSH14_00735 [Verrucomicrobiia bacterium]
MKLKETLKLGGRLLGGTKASTPPSVPTTECEIDLQHEDDEVLVRRTQRGDSAAFDVLV